MKVLILKLGATGDVVRTTPLLRRFTGPATWITAARNIVFVQNLRENLRCLSWEQRDAARDTSYDLVINLEDELENARFIGTLKYERLFGAYADEAGTMRYTADSRRWFDLSLISSFGRKEADRLKLLNRHTYQDLIFSGLGLQFANDAYLLPEPTEAGLAGDVAIAPEAGPVWPMKNWAFYAPLQRELEARGLTVNVLPRRATLLEHLCDVRNHRCLVGGDSLPMHLALGSKVRCVSLFTCTSPWEIHGYGLQRKLISPLLEQFFYQRGFDARATSAITLEEALSATLEQLQASTPGQACVPQT
jgi:heptosyltransferase-2